jgi:serine/threonine protein phosphatase PrpC
VFALCSDGIYKACPELLGELKKITPQKSLMDTADKIAAQVDANGAPDNYSLVLLRV